MKEINTVQIRPQPFSPLTCNRFYVKNINKTPMDFFSTFAIKKKINIISLQTSLASIFQKTYPYRFLIMMPF